LGYRADIDGLRAIAVLLVVFFHAFPDLISAGFIGVDIFFVISGYLITRIIIEAIQREDFSILNFYGRRIRRIIPSLMLVLIFALLFGWFLLSAEDFSILGKHIASSVLFIVNFTFTSELNYFDTAAIAKPLLHLWSLAVEEQFYIFWPILLITFSRSKNFLKLIFVIFVFSFLFNVIYSQIKPSANFFLPFGRFWELMIGGIIAYVNLFYIQETKHNLLAQFKSYSSYLGFVFIILALLVIDEKSIYPNFYALLPVVGSALIIFSDENNLINRYLLSNKLLVQVGLFSYPLYLWHWLLLSMMFIIKGETLHRDTKIAAIIISFLFAWLTFRYFENFFRKRSVEFNFKILPVSFLTVGILGYVVFSNNGYQNRPVIQYSDLESSFKKFEYEIPLECGLNEYMSKVTQVCKSDSRNIPRYALLGDSKAEVLANAFMRTSSENGRWLIIGGNAGYGGPAPFLSDLPRFSNAQGFINPAINAINKNRNIEVVAIATAARGIGDFDKSSNWLKAKEATGYKEGEEALKRVVKRFVSTEKKVVLIVDNPGLGSHKSCTKREIEIPFVGKYSFKLADDCELGLDKYFDLRKKYIQVLQNIEESFPGNVFIFDTYEDVCNLTLKKCMRTVDNRATFSYTDHLSDYVAEKIGKRLNKFLNERF